MAKSPKPHDTAGQAEGGNRRDFLYVATGTLGAVGVAAASWPFIHQMNPSAAVLALASTEVDLSAIEQLVDASQTRALSAAMLYAREHYVDGKRSLREILDLVMRDIAEHGLDVLDKRLVGEHALFRRFELAATLNRLPSLQVAGDP